MFVISCCEFEIYVSEGKFDKGKSIIRAVPTSVRIYGCVVTNIRKQCACLWTSYTTTNDGRLM